MDSELRAEEGVYHSLDANELRVYPLAGLLIPTVFVCLSQTSISSILCYDLCYHPSRRPIEAASNNLLLEGTQAIRLVRP